ncbi:transposase [Streptomyces sp. b62]|uniref:transposase n=1 Tax=Streptomyces sp. b62 TaxID=1827627 RepID=UPI0035A17787
MLGRVRDVGGSLALSWCVVRKVTDQAWAVNRAVVGSASDGAAGAGPASSPQRCPVEAVQGAAWRDLPERYGPRKTVCEQFRRWSADGTWDRLLAHVQRDSDATGGRLVDRVRRLDGRAGPPARGRDR